MTTVIAITPGEPAGIGPDLAIIAAQQVFDAKLVYFADPDMLAQRAQLLNIQSTICILTSLDDIPMATPGTLQVWPVSTASPVIPGVLDPANAPYVLDCIRQAVESQQNGKTQALMTGPVHKGIINQANIKFSGHTEYLAQLTSAVPVMMLAAEAEKLRVALVTTHLPLNKVSEAITQQSLQQVITILQHDLQQKYAIPHPHILVCGLNPHAGEDGNMGMEEIETITPVLNRLRQQGYHLTGPLPADTLFTPKYLQTADAVLAMYHDQGLPVLKYAGFGHAINITLGLPVIRISVDHGTALDLAGTSQVETGSYIEALNTAIYLANKQALSLTNNPDNLSSATI